jgi:hypothetical protein
VLPAIVDDVAGMSTSTSRASLRASSVEIEKSFGLSTSRTQPRRHTVFS